MNVCIFGDSITWGAFDTEKGGWVNRSKLFFENNGYDVDVYNLGISGDNTEDVLKRFEAESLAREPEVVIFAIGINDSQYVNSKNNPRVPLDKFRNNIKNLIDQSKKITEKFFFIGLVPIDETKLMPVPWSLEKYYDDENVNLYNKAIQEVCDENGVTFLEMASVLDKNDLEDGLHPNSEGHEKIFKNVIDFLMEEIDFPKYN